MDNTRSVAILTNPERDELVAEVVKALGSLDPTMLEPASADEIIDSVRTAVTGGADTVVAVGGDGTQRSVAAGLVGSDAALGVIAGGTVNLLAQVLGLDELDRAVATIADGSRRSIDVGRCNGELFLLNASSGYDATVIAEADDGHKERFGRLSFLRAAAAAFRRVRAAHVTITIDGEPCFDGRAMSVIVTNVAERSSSDLRIAPEARFDDGILDVLIVRADTVRVSLRLLWALARDRTPRSQDLLRGAGAEIDIEWTRPMDGQCDGDPTGRSKRFEVRTEPAALVVLT